VTFLICYFLRPSRWYACDELVRGGAEASRLHVPRDMQVFKASPCLPQCCIARFKPAKAVVLEVVLDKHHRRLGAQPDLKCSCVQMRAHTNETASSSSPLDNGPCGVDVLSGGCALSRALLWGSLIVGSGFPIAVFRLADLVRFCSPGCQQAGSRLLLANCMTSYIYIYRAPDARAIAICDGLCKLKRRCTARPRKRPGSMVCVACPLAHQATCGCSCS
jgi:hypothetical protein